MELAEIQAAIHSFADALASAMRSAERAAQGNHTQQMLGSLRDAREATEILAHTLSPSKP